MNNKFLFDERNNRWLGYDNESSIDWWDVKWPIFQLICMFLHDKIFLRCGEWEPGAGTSFLAIFTN